MKQVRIPMDDSDHEELSKFKKDHGLTWKEMLQLATEEKKED